MQQNLIIAPFIDSKLVPYFAKPGKRIRSDNPRVIIGCRDEEMHGQRSPILNIEPPTNV